VRYVILYDNRIASNYIISIIKYEFEVSFIRTHTHELKLYRPWRPLGLREIEAPTFSDIRMGDGGKFVSSRSPPPFTPRKIAGTHFCRRLSRPQGHRAAGRG
jgi:hypothetical protein